MLTLGLQNLKFYGYVHPVLHAVVLHAYAKAIVLVFHMLISGPWCHLCLLAAEALPLHKKNK